MLTWCNESETDQHLATTGYQDTYFSRSLHEQSHIYHCNRKTSHLDTRCQHNYQYKDHRHSKNMQAGHPHNATDQETLIWIDPCAQIAVIFPT